MQQTENAAAVAEKKSLAPRDVVVIGAASGGAAALANIIPKLPSSFSASVIVVQEMRPGFTRLLASDLSTASAMTVEEAEHRQSLRRNIVLIAPGMRGVTLARGPLAEFPFMTVLEDLTESVAKTRSRIDIAMKSAVEMFGPRTVGVLLTGAGTDGLEGMKAIRACGGKTIAQDQESSLLYDMPRAAIDAGVVDEVLPLWSIADRLAQFIGDE